jgi:hypothetical protein
MLIGSCRRGHLELSSATESEQATGGKIEITLPDGTRRRRHPVAHLQRGGEQRSAKLRECPGGEGWTRLIDTNHPESAEAGFTTGGIYVATECSVLVIGHPKRARQAVR